MYVNLIETFKNTCEAFNITYLVEGGSVLGAFRYHGFVPWDDDFDCKVNVSQKHNLKKALDDIPGHTHMSCDKLFGVYPLVHRFKIGNASFEELRLGNKILYSVERPGMKLVKPLHS